MEHAQHLFEDGDGQPPAKSAKIDNSKVRRIIPIISDEVRGQTIPLAEFYTIQFLDKQKISPFLKKVPLVCEGFDHLKRVDKTGRVLLQPATNPLSEKNLMVLQQLEVGETQIQIMSVPASRPLTTRQFDWAKEYWPTSFHPDKVCVCQRAYIRIPYHSVIGTFNLREAKRSYNFS
ncbi:hypothetical protein TELCIR_09513 [Teladorsagia circumcincta]|uniref:Uncharacterized protein n=1 Tax=Teladorsagia circumcincta TaxID=45464 RepID=A0A2G9UEN0_TELCI|nr:hypothetical protein TELCIR_09513 [Teladorsagia circumcincta]